MSLSAGAVRNGENSLVSSSVSATVSGDGSRTGDVGSQSLENSGVGRNDLRSARSRIRSRGGRGGLSRRSHDRGSRRGVSLSARAVRDGQSAVLGDSVSATISGDGSRAGDVHGQSLNNGGESGRDFGSALRRRSGGGRGGRSARRLGARSTTGTSHSAAGGARAVSDGQSSGLSNSVGLRVSRHSGRCRARDRDRIHNVDGGVYNRGRIRLNGSRRLLAEDIRGVGIGRGSAQRKKERKWAH